MKCIALLPNGNVACKVPLAEVKNVYFVDLDFEFASLAAAYSLAGWKTAIGTNLTMYIPRGKTSYEVTTDDPNILITEEGQKIITNEPAPSAIFYLDSNYCDYNDLRASFQGGTYGVIYELRTGALLMKRTVAGKFVGFPARINAISPGIPLNGDIVNNFRLYINHTDYRDFELGALINPEWDNNELQLAMPAGLTMQATSVLAADDIDVLITERCGDAVTGLTDSEFEVLGSNFLTSPAVTAVVDNGAGSYTVTIEKGAGPESLASGDYVVIRVKDGTPVDQLSNRLTVVMP